MPSVYSTSRVNTQAVRTRMPIRTLRDCTPSPSNGRAVIQVLAVHAICAAHALHVVCFGHFHPSHSLISGYYIYSSQHLRCNTSATSPRGQKRDVRRQKSDGKLETRHWKPAKTLESRSRRKQPRDTPANIRTIGSIRIRRFFATLCYATQRIVFSPSNCRKSTIHPSVRIV